MRTVVLHSGGIDSTVLLYDRIAQGDKVHALALNYGQTHQRELIVGHDLCEQLDVPRSVAILDTAPFKGSELTGGHGVVVPNRNMVLISMAGAFAESIGYDAVAIACHAGDGPLFPDCRPSFLEEAFRALGRATERRVRLLYPYAYESKLEVVRLGVKLGVPFDQTWSCYRNEPLPCEECLACKERREALFLAGAPV
jgi:7-cyano-7-deazaguanine synthase